MEIGRRMITLGIETATEIGSLALIENGSLLGQVHLNKKFALSRNLVQTVEFLFRSLSIQPRELSGIAVSIGPGSYTGLRIGLAAAKGMSLMWSLPVVAVNSLDAFAEQAPWPEILISPLIRFRKKEYYFAFYRKEGENSVRQSDYAVGKLEQILEQSTEEIGILGMVHPDDRVKLYDLQQMGKLRFGEQIWPSAFRVAQLGERELRKGLAGDMESLSPFYMHDFPVHSR